MRVLRQFLFIGPSLLALEPVVRLTLDPEGQDLLAPGEVARRAAQRLDAQLPEDVSLVQVAETAEGRISLAGCIAALALLLQREFGYRVQYSEILPPKLKGEVEIAFAYADSGLALPLGRQAVELMALAVAPPPAGDGGRRLAESFDRAMVQLRQAALIPSTRCSVWEADRRGIPWSCIAQGEGAVQLGQGRKRRRLRGTYTQDTSFLGAKLATSKVAAAALLGANGIPVPRHRLVTSAEAAVSAAAAIGYPVVVKPNGRDMGTAVGLNLGDAEAVKVAFATARVHGPVLVEELIAGSDHRVSLLNGRMIAAGSDIAAHVVGDGESTVQTLIDRINADPRRGVRDFSQMRVIHPDAMIRQTLAAQGHGLESVPAAGDRVALRRWWRAGRDHSAEDLTDSIHPANRAMIERAARLIGLDLVGVDFITPDITRPWFEVGGAIHDINPTPGLRTHIKAGKPDVHRIILESFFPPGDDGRLPLAVIASSPGAAAVVDLVARLLTQAGHCVAAASTKGLAVGTDLVLRATATGAAGARIALNDPAVTAAVLEVSDDATAAEGLGFDRAKLAAVMATPESAPAAGLLLRCASDLAVLSADLPEVVALADHSRAKAILWVTRDPRSERVARHIAGGGKAVALDDAGGAAGGEAEVLLWEAGQRHRVCRLADMAVQNGQADRMALPFAIALAFGLGLPVEEIARHLPRA